MHIVSNAAALHSYADLCWRMQTYANVCKRMLTYADVCWRMLTLTYADVCYAIGAGVRDVWLSNEWWMHILLNPDGSGRSNYCCNKRVPRERLGCSPASCSRGNQYMQPRCTTPLICVARVNDKLFGNLIALIQDRASERERACVCESVCVCVRVHDTTELICTRFRM